ncbi:uncharacterized protein LOC103715150 [Phoenix dactylifera]|uniref:Uncharacterized protein LOC103715150 n=1 Tax=Phoenix dactylifera TaxID=42345 RepID=A0A8B7CKI3_PHODC|nr:uncharacterized protein LOC103715150 [Phoenix dactylifera]
METEAFPYRFYRGIRLYWRRRKYERVDGSGYRKKAARVTRFGSGRGGNRRFWRIRPLFRIRIKIPSPVRLLARLRDAYVDAMLGLAGKGSALVLPNGPEALWDKRIPKRRPVRVDAGSYFEQRLILEIYKSVAASRELTTI